MPPQRNWRLSRKAARTYPQTYLGAAESNFGPDQGVLEKRIPAGIGGVSAFGLGSFQAERRSGPKGPQPQGVAREIASGCVRFGEDRPTGIPVAKAALPEAISLATASKIGFGIGSN